MSTETINARIRVRPLRFGFVLNPSERKTLRRVIETNTCLWNGLFNFIIPLFKRTPMLYRDQYLPGPTKQLMDGLVEAFEPDFLVEETREGAISDGTLELLNEWAGLTQYPSPDGFVFPSERLVTPLSLDNLWRRNMFPTLDKIGLGWATFQVLRKTNASLSKKAGVDPKVASDQRGRGLGVSLEVYINSDLEQKRAALKGTRSRRASKAKTVARTGEVGLME